MSAEDAVDTTVTKAAADRKRLRITIATFFGLLVGGLLLFYFRPTRVPTLIRATAEEAPAMLADVGLDAGARGEIATSSVAAGYVVSQDPQGGSLALRHTSVDFTYTVTPEAAKVPNVVGTTEAEAKQALEAELFRPGFVEILGEPDPVGTVLEQLPKAGADWVTGRTVGLAVAAGPDDGTGVEVPDVVGQTVDIAAKTLGQYGLRAGGFTIDPDITTAVVLGQLPRAGVVVRPGTTVLVLGSE